MKTGPGTGGVTMYNLNRAEIPKQIIKLNQAVETLAHLDFSDMEHVRRVVSGIRWDLGEVNLELSDLLNGEAPPISEDQTRLI
jgi:hypothetical protein